MIYKSLSILALSFLILNTSCNKNKKLAKLEGNKKEYKVTPVELTERIYITVPNTIVPAAVGAAGWGACQDFTNYDFPIIGYISPILYENMIPSSNPNPYAHLTHNIKPLAVKMDMAATESCDFAMLDGVLEVIICNSSLALGDAFVFRDPSNPDATFNAVKLGQFENGIDGDFDNLGATLNLNVDEDAVIDQFIHAGDFNLFMRMHVDRAFTDDFAIIRTDMTLSAELINEE